MIAEFTSISSLMRRLNTIKKKSPELPVVMLGQGLTTRLAVGYTNLNKPINEYTVISEDDYNALEDKTSHSKVVVLVGCRS